MATGRGISLRERHKQQTRADLLEASAQLIGERGYQETTIDDIAEAAGTSRATVYAHFPSKEAIAQAVIIGMWDRAEELYQEFGRLPDWSAQRVRGWLETVVTSWEASSVPLRVAAAGVVRYDAFYLEYHRRFVNALTSNRELWSRFSADEAQRRALLLISGLELFLNTWLVRGWENDRAATIDTLADVWRSTLRADENIPRE